MHRFTDNSVTAAVIALLFGLSAIAATSPKENLESAVLSVSEIDRASVKVHAPKHETAVQLIFLFRDKDAQQALRIFWASKTGRLRITDGTTVIVETKMLGIAESDAFGKKRGGLILSFASLEEANRVATALRPFLK